MPTLFDSLELGSLSLDNRVFMAPMTRGRATADGVPTEIMATYYRQRSGAGLIVTEATAISPQGVGWVHAPGTWTDPQQAGWQRVTEAVHAAGGRIMLQLWHMGRVSHPDFQPGGVLPVGPSAIAAQGHTTTPQGKRDYVTPRALDAAELPGIAADYAAAARRAIAAGFDGVEIHGANGYLLDQFIRDRSNQRQDDFGGSIENRWRFPLMVVDAVTQAVGAARTAIRLSPTNRYNDMADRDPVATYAHGAAQLGRRGLAFVHVVEPRPDHMLHDPQAPAVAPTIREHFRGGLVINGGFDLVSAQEVLDQGLADAVAFGVPFLTSPDWPERLRRGAAPNAPDFATFYTNGPQGYIDYPALEG